MYRYNMDNNIYEYEKVDCLVSRTDYNSKVYVSFEISSHQYDIII